jgi:hypothetical protein
MAYMSQERKKVIAAELKKVIPKDWKYSLGVDNHSSLVLNIWSAPVDLVGMWNAKAKARQDHEHPEWKFEPQKSVQLNHYYLENVFEGEVLDIFQKIKKEMHRGNHDNSDIMTDYHDVGWYVNMNLGKWDKPFEVK